MRPRNASWKPPIFAYRLEIRRSQPGWIDLDFFPPNGIKRSNGFLQSIIQPTGFPGHIG